MYRIERKGKFRYGQRVLISSSSASQNVRIAKGRVLTVGCYLPALKTWHMLLEAHGYFAISFVLKNGYGNVFKQGPFSVIVLGQSVDDEEKKRLVEALRKCSSAPIISVPSKAGEPTDGADIHAEPDPEEVLRWIADLIHRQESHVAA